jgi:hypothetical protein
MGLFYTFVYFPGQKKHLAAMRIYLFVYIVSFILFTPVVYGQKVDPVAFFKEDAQLELNLLGHLKMIDQPKEVGVKRPGYARLVWPDGTEQKGAIEFTARGKSRLSYCDPPPLMLFFKNNNEGPLSKLGKLKLVWSCSSTDYYNQLLLREYLIYKMYNLITPYSFRARLTNVAFADSSRKGSVISRIGFLIEDVDDLATRHQCREYEDTMVVPERTNRQQYALMAMFQYMIGNTDWSIANYQNIKLIVEDTSSYLKPIPVPYDFDNSGLVDAEYAIPNEKIPVENVRQRYNKAMALPIEDIKMAAAVFRDAQAGIMNLVESQAGLSSGTRRYMHNYLNVFFEEMKDLDSFCNVFIKTGGQVKSPKKN